MVKQVSASVLKVSTEDAASPRQSIVVERVLVATERLASLFHLFNITVNV